MIFRTIVAIGALSVWGAGLAAQPQVPAPAPFRPNLLPMPASIEPRGGGVRISDGFSLTFAGYREPRLDRAADRFRSHLTVRLGRGIPTTGLQVRVTVAGPAGGDGSHYSAGSPDESYRLTVRPSGIDLVAPTPAGAIYGFETLFQLVEIDGGGLSVPSVEINDRPRYPWRGLLLDVGRHFEPVAAVKRQLEGMAAAKLNVLHWHLSEDQGFPIESRRFPKLHTKGGTRGYYTQAEVREIVAYAGDRAIRVIPEFDMPGHSTAWFVGYPELASAPGPYHLETRFGVFRPAFDPTRESVYRFLDAFVGEMATLFPDPYWHIGGDEVEPHDWRANRRIRAFMAGHGMKRPAALQAWFNHRLAGILAKHGRRMIGWDEIMDGDLPAGTVVQSWRGETTVSQAVVRGFPVIQSWGLYLDHIKPAEEHYAVDPTPSGFLGDPGVIWGGEACMWGEQISGRTVDSRIWPRALAVAERLWSRAEVTDVDDYYQRAAAVSHALAERGLGHESHTRLMLGALAPPEARGALAALLDLAVPVTFPERAELQRPLTGTPHDRLVDVASPDAWRTRRSLSRLVDRFLADPARQAGRDSLTMMSEGWRDLAARIGALTGGDARVADARPAAEALGAAAAAGLASLETLAGRHPLSPAEAAQVRATADRIGRPQGLLRLDVRPGLTTLFAAALALSGMP